MEHVSIAQAKRELSKLVNRAAFGHEIIVLTSRGKPKAVLLGLEDFERLSLSAKTAEENIVKLESLWEGTPEITEEEISQVRQEMWSRVEEREV